MAYNKAREEQKWKKWKEREEEKLRELGIICRNAQCTQFHGKWAEKDRNFGVTLMIEPVFMRATREGVKIMVVIIGLVIIFKKQLNELVTKIFEKITNESSGI